MRSTTMKTHKRKHEAAVEIPLQQTVIPANPEPLLSPGSQSSQSKFN